jgi:hypothetical protein
MFAEILASYDARQFPPQISVVFNDIETVVLDWKAHNKMHAEQA